MRTILFLTLLFSAFTSHAQKHRGATHRIATSINNEKDFSLQSYHVITAFQGNNKVDTNLNTVVVKDSVLTWTTSGGVKTKIRLTLENISPGHTLGFDEFFYQTDFIYHGEKMKCTATFSRSGNRLLLSGDNYKDYIEFD
jgi:hypothetical protein